MSDIKKGSTFIDWANIKKETVFIDKDGNEIVENKEKPKTLADLIERRAKRMGR